MSSVKQGLARLECVNQCAVKLIADENQNSGSIAFQSSTLPNCVNACQLQTYDRSALCDPTQVTNADALACAEGVNIGRQVDSDSECADRCVETLSLSEYPTTIKFQGTMPTCLQFCAKQSMDCDQLHSDDASRRIGCNVGRNILNHVPIGGTV